MKQKFLFVLLLFLISSSHQIKAQNLDCSQFIKSQFQGNIEKYFVEKLKYPLEAIMADVQGKVVLDFRINESGKIDSINISMFPHEKMAEEAVNILLSTKDMWTATLCDSKPTSYIYKITVDYIITYDRKAPKDKIIILKEKAIENLEKKKLNKALDFINQAIELNSYDYDLYNVRSKIYSEQYLTDLADSDKSLAAKLEKEIICNDITVYTYAAKRNTKTYDYIIQSKGTNDLVSDSTIGIQPDTSVFILVEQPPEFPGGEIALLKFLQKNVKYPLSAAEKNISGRVVINFIVEADGKITQIKLIESIGGACDEEAIRVIKAMPNWKPGKTGGKPVPVYFTLPIRFILDDYTK